MCFCLPTTKKLALEGQYLEYRSTSRSIPRLDCSLKESTMARKLCFLLYVCPLMVVVLLFTYISMLDLSRDWSTSNVIDLKDPRTRLRSARNEHVSTTSLNEIHKVDRSMCLKYCKNYSIESYTAHNAKNVQDSINAIRSRGYILSFRYYEQQTQATRNLLQMQCLADSIGSVIVEPFLSSSLFVIPFQEFSSSTEPTDEFLTLSDLMDTQLWNRETLKMFGYKSIATWNNFIEHAPRNVIIHCIQYPSPPLYIPYPGNDYKTQFSDKCYKKFDASLSFLRKYGFKLVRKSCSDFSKSSEPVPVSSFVENILGSYKASEVTILINQFNGFFGLRRLPVLSECGIKHHKMTVPVIPSVRIQTDAQKYFKKVFNGRPYVAILARLERAVYQLQHEIEQCASEVDAILKQLRASHKISDTFLAMDVGRFGSNGATRKNLQPHGEKLFQHIYQEKWSFKEWEETFDRIAGTNNSAYIANLQRTIAARGDCLIRVGGGSFQGRATTLYAKYHPDTDCTFEVCTTISS